MGTEANPADDASRGLTADAIVQCNRWTMGPEFLWLDEESWPKTPIAVTEEIQKEPTGHESLSTVLVMVLVEEIRSLDAQI